MGNNYFDGMLPKSLGNLSRFVENFEAGDCGIKGIIPNEIGNLSNSIELDIGSNELIGRIPDTLGQLRKLQKLILDFNKLRGKTLLPVLCTSLITTKRISYYELLDATKKFSEENLIGKGSAGSVYKEVFSDGMIPAIKMFNLDLEEANNNFDSACQILCNIRHKNLVKVISSCSNLHLKALVLEYMPNGNLTKWLFSRNYFLNIAQRLEIMIDVASALEYLYHGNPYSIVHCDLKPSNILLDEDMVVHVTDFGIVKLLAEDQIILLTNTLGTIGYMAPKYGSTGLISAMGLCIWRHLQKKKPIDDMFVGEFTMRRWVFESLPDGIMQIVDVDLVNAIEDNIRAKESCSNSIMRLALERTADLPSERLNMKDVLIWLETIKTEFC
ncbi:probable LRR receptor-like serine threonine-kinase At3g47570 [Olea europaea subsp. europaea]|uniref:Probable LRR receptor-like serine threonine-kinase At3g47570 n=1 Tax=Olea europaea subsp. europaea TaxID=158383 RepID=A0A8S0U9C7_OLEEU|nr:probable LRR receptor-like serine threonine-kinase At3g47570 [Olea europaea subsp. europaea]